MGMLNFISILLGLFTVVEWNCENLFDTQHQPPKRDTEFLPDGTYHWTTARYWKKLRHVGQTLMACGGDEKAWQLPDVIALCEVENDSVMRDLTKRSPFRQAHYNYLITQSPDERGINVALLYSPYSFRLLRWHAVRVNPIQGMRPTRDLLYAAGELLSGDTLHLLVVHAPSRSGGERITRPNRRAVAQQIVAVVDSIRLHSATNKILVLGDFNDYAQDENLQYLLRHQLVDVSAHAKGANGAKGTYKYKGVWDSLDHILCSETFKPYFRQCQVMDAPFLLTTDDSYGGVRPFRTYYGRRYSAGFSDHLPLVAHFWLPD